MLFHVCDGVLSGWLFDLSPWQRELGSSDWKWDGNYVQSGRNEPSLPASRYIGSVACQYWILEMRWPLVLPRRLVVRHRASTCHSQKADCRQHMLNRILFYFFPPRLFTSNRPSPGVFSCPQSASSPYTQPNPTGPSCRDNGPRSP